MGWEYRGASGPYYTRSRRIDGQVVREYVGGGLVGQLGAQADAAARTDRMVEAARLRAEQARWAALEAESAELDDLVDLLTTASLVLAGYHRHDRGNWRRRRDREVGAADEIRG